MSIALPQYFATRNKATLDNAPRSLAKASHVVKRLSVMYLPSFSFDATWRGASTIVKEFRYELGSNVSFLKTTPPSNVNFVACVAWKPTSETIVRYKLWEDVGEILWVPLYNGEKIGDNFSIEIWNVQPEVEAGGDTLVTEDGFEIITEDEGYTLVTEGGSAIGTVETIVSVGTGLFHLSKLIIPSTRCEGSDPTALSYTEECRDVTLDLDGFNPFDGDYYTVDDDCGNTTLVNGNRFIGTELILQSTDETWHRVYLMRWDGNTHVVVDQDNTDPSDTPFIYLQTTPGNGVKIDLMLFDGNHHLRIDQNEVALFDYTVLYLQTAEDTLYYGVKIQFDGDSYYLQIAQDNTVI